MKMLILINSMREFLGRLSSWVKNYNEIDRKDRVISTDKIKKPLFDERAKKKFYKVQKLKEKHNAIMKNRNPKANKFF